ncbi:MAG: thioredoxin domain-containing protein [archaeon]|jgi:protein-disulfide isomerase|nr:disulfide bond formation protein DsbA [Euryarchaeota archaeon]MDP6704189.1 thioredoxin domain-containing protein [archaeon]MDP7260716.1 thioredoxin domain-containing protein [archaeon]HIK01424.1 thioredoxin domain-containing protein [Candidatus Undinarchaeales archaeon ERR594346 U_76725]|tara:strand:+ start:18096 stop:18914 length:819 start_codon:yes stop_codon:yes gene_type:complete
MAKGDKTITLKFKEATLWKVATAVLAIILLFSFQGGEVEVQEEGSVAAATIKTIDLSIDDDPVLGNDNAEITVIEFSDFQCQFCNRLWADAVNGIKTNFVEDGTVKFVYRDFPLNFHPSAAKAATAANCAEEQGQYWEMHDKLFENQQSDWGYYVQEERKYLALEDAMPFFRQYASELGLDTDKFNDCLDSDKYDSEISKDLVDGQTAGVTGTPSVFVMMSKKKAPKAELQALDDGSNIFYFETSDGKYAGIQVAGALPYGAFEQIINIMLT